MIKFYFLILVGFIGRDCEFNNTCLSNPCKNKGSCITINSNSFKCLCDSRFTGTFCETGSNKYLNYK